MPEWNANDVVNGLLCLGVITLIGVVYIVATTPRDELLRILQKMYGDR